MIDIGVELKGFEHVSSILNDLPFKVRNRIIKHSLRRGAMVFQKAAKSLVPSRSGVLKRSIKARTGRGMVAQAYVDGSTGWYAHLVEHGVRRHSLARGADLSRGKKQDIGRIHPGYGGRLFMQKTAEAQTEAAITAIAERFESLLYKELNK